MNRVYDLVKNPQGEVLTIRVYHPGASLECVRIVFEMAPKYNDPIAVYIVRDPAVSVVTVVDELRKAYTFVEGPRWRDSVAKQWERYNALFASKDNSEPVNKAE